jgi:hypothetical protein
MYKDSFLAFIDPSFFGLESGYGFNREEYTNWAGPQTRAAAVLALSRGLTKPEPRRISLRLQRLIRVELLALKIGARLFGSRRIDLFL